MPWPFHQPATPIGRIYGPTGLIASDSIKAIRAADLTKVSDSGSGCANCCCLCVGYDIVIAGVTMATCVNFNAPIPNGVGHVVRSMQLNGNVNGKYYINALPPGGGDVGPNTLGLYGCGGSLDLACKFTTTFFEGLNCTGAVQANWVNHKTVMSWSVLPVASTTGDFDPQSYSFTVASQFNNGGTQCGPFTGGFPMNFFINGSSPPPWLCGPNNRCGTPMVLANTNPSLGAFPVGLGIYAGIDGTVTITPKFS